MLTTERPSPSLDARGFEQLVFDLFERDRDLYAPLEIRGAERSTVGRDKLGGTVRIAWQGREVEFQIEIKSRTAPKIIQQALWNLKPLSLAERKAFLLVVPYITPRIREMVELEGVNCLDVNGNYLIQNPAFLAIRLDRKNRFPESAPIKKIYSGNSSQVGRLLLSKKQTFTSVNEVFEAVNRTGVPLSLSADLESLERTGGRSHHREVIQWYRPHSGRKAPRSPARRLRSPEAHRHHETETPRQRKRD